MLVTEIVKRINKLLAGEQLTYRQLEPFLDEVIYDINSQLNSCFPAFSELEADITSEVDYNFFPEKYVRDVVVKGAAYKFYIMDEEGMQTADMYGYDYQNTLFVMTRDYIDFVPEEYDTEQTGSLVFEQPDGKDEPFYHSGVMW